MRKGLPMGKKDPWGQCCPSKRVLLHRALQKNDISELTLGEKAVVDEFLAHCATVQKENEKFEKKVEKLTTV